MKWYNWLFGAALAAAYYVDTTIFGATYVDVVRHTMLLAGLYVAYLILWWGIHPLVRDWRHRRR